MQYSQMWISKGLTALFVRFGNLHNDDVLQRRNVGSSEFRGA